MLRLAPLLLLCACTRAVPSSSSAVTPTPQEQAEATWLTLETTADLTTARDHWHAVTVDSPSTLIAWERLALTHLRLSELYAEQAHRDTHLDAALSATNACLNTHEAFGYASALKLPLSDALVSLPPTHHGCLQLHLEAQLHRLSHQGSAHAALEIPEINETLSALATLNLPTDRLSALFSLVLPEYAGGSQEDAYLSFEQAEAHPRTTRQYARYLLLPAGNAEDARARLLSLSTQTLDSTELRIEGLLATDHLEHLNELSEESTPRTVSR